MSFHLGKPILVMLAIALIAGAASFIQPAQKKAELRLWVFADSHLKSYQGPIQKFAETNHITTSVNQVAYLALDLRLTSMFMSNPTTPELPDVVEIEMNLVGKYFRPPVDQVGLLPLNDFLRESGWQDKIVQQRLATWTKDGKIFGIPHDVHPVTFMYRRDLYDEAGVDMEVVKTWPQFHEACLKFETYWKSHGFPYRHAVEQSPSDSALVQQILLQRGINIVDQNNVVHINDPRVAQTIVFYAQMNAGPKKIGGQSAGTEVSRVRDILDSNLCGFYTADWWAGYIKRYAQSMPGKFYMIPLPRFEPSDPPTTTWGGTMIGITKACKRPKDAWKLIEYLYFSDECLEIRRKENGILPPVMSVWDRPIYHQPDPFFYGNQKAQELFVELGRQVPVRYQTPASVIAASSLVFVLNRAIAYVDEHQTADGLEPKCQEWLDVIAKDLNRRIAHWRFD